MELPRRPERTADDTRALVDQHSSSLPRCRTGGGRYKRRTLFLCLTTLSLLFGPFAMICVSGRSLLSTLRSPTDSQQITQTSLHHGRVWSLSVTGRECVCHLHTSVLTLAQVPDGVLHSPALAHVCQKTKISASRWICAAALLATLAVSR